MAGLRWAGDRERGDDHKPARAAVSSRLEYVRRPVAVRGHVFIGVPRGDLPGDVIHDVHARAPLAQDGLVTEIAFYQPNVLAPAERLGERGPAHERGDRVSPRAQRLDQMGTDEAGAAGHEGFHSGLS